MTSFATKQMIAFGFTCASFILWILAIATNYVCHHIEEDTCWALGDDYFEVIDTINDNSKWSTVRTLHIVVIIMMAIVFIYYPVGKFLNYYEKTEFKIVEFSLQTLSFVLGLVALITSMSAYEDAAQKWAFGYYATLFATLFILPAHLLWIYYYFKGGE